MSMFLSYSKNGKLVAGHTRISSREHGSTLWTLHFSFGCNTPAHLNDSEIVVQDCRQAPCRITSTAGWSAPRAATELYAGGNRWVAFLSGIGLYDGLARTLAGMGKHSVGYDGTLAYAAYQATHGVTIEDASRMLITRNDSIPVTSTCCVDRSAVAVFAAADAQYINFWNGSLWVKHRLHVPAYKGHIFRHRDRVYVANDGKIHDLEDPNHGWVVGEPGKRYNTCGWSDGTRIFVAWSENEGANIESVHEEPLIGDPKPWPVELPVFEKTHLKIGIGMFDDLVGPRIIDTFEHSSSNTKALLHNEGGSVSLDTSRIYAERANIPCERYTDKHGAAIPTDQNDRSLVYCYPTPGQSVAYTVEKVQRDVKNLHERGLPFDCAVALYRMWNGFVYVLTEQEVCDTIGALWPLFLEYPPGALWIMSKNRGNGQDGIIASRAFQETLVRLKLASGDWTHFPAAVLTPTPEPEKNWFTSIPRFVMSDLMPIKGVRKQINWNDNKDGKGDRPIFGYARPLGGLNAQGEGQIQWGKPEINGPGHPNPQDDEPDAESAITLHSHGPNKADPCDAYFTNGDRYQLSQMPGSQKECDVQTRRHGAVDRQELWYDGAKAGLGDILIHASGLCPQVVR